MLWPLKCRILSFRPVVTNTYSLIDLQVSHHQGWTTMSKMKVKLSFRDAWNSLMAWPDWPWLPSHILRQIYATVKTSRSRDHDLGLEASLSLCMSLTLTTDIEFFKERIFSHTAACNHRMCEKMLSYFVYLNFRSATGIWILPHLWRNWVELSFAVDCSVTFSNGVGTNFGVGVEEASPDRPKGRQRGMWFLGRGQFPTN